MTTELKTRTLGPSCTKHHTAMAAGAPSPTGAGPGEPAQMMAAFRALGIGANAPSSQARTTAWYRTRGTDWARVLR